MSVEVATYVNDLQAVNPPSTDPRSQGDDHLRLIKTVLQNQFPRASRPRPVETWISKATSYTVLSTDDQTTFNIDTSAGAVTLTLPSLAASDAGWEISFTKSTSDVNPVFIAPPSGTIASGTSLVAKARRCIPGIYLRVVWSGTAFRCQRAMALPIGTMLDYAGASLPAGFEWPNGQTLASASTNYPEYNAVIGSGVTLDLRGRYAATLDALGGSAASRITTAGGGVDGATLAAVGGAQNVTLVTNNLPAYTPAGTIANGAITNSAAGANVTLVHTNGDLFTHGTGNYAFVAVDMSASYSQASSTFTGTAQGGISTAIKILPPTIMLSKILIVE